MQINKYPIQQQARGEFNGGEIVENKPLGFPGEGGGLKPYSNLFYWAHAKGVTDSTIGLHPHQGFEIISFVLKGHIRHYDTRLQGWKPLQTGDVQIIRAGKGISHSEFLAADAAIFQIWFDPDLSKTIQKEASYDDYVAAVFPEEKLPEGGITTYIGSGSPFVLDTPGVEIHRIRLKKGKHSISIAPGKIVSAYILSGTADISGTSCIQDDFLIIRDTDTLSISEASDADIFFITSPAALNYLTYSQLMQRRI